MTTVPTDSISDHALDSLRRRFTVVADGVEIGARHFEFFRPHSADDLISEEEFNRDERLPYWAELWMSSIALAERLATGSDAGRRLLELGCGIGLAATVAASAGFAVTATDYYADALEFARLNALHNGVPTVTTRHVDWRDFPEDLGRFDIVAASDVLYERPNVALVAAIFAATLGPSGIGLLTDPQRKHATEFPEACHLHGLQIVRLTHIPLSRNGTQQTIDLYEIQRI